MDNKEIAKIFYEMAALMEMQDIAFKPRAYERAAQAIENLDEEISARYVREGRESLESIEGVGKGIADHLEELLRTGSFREYVRMKKKIPVDVGALMAIEGVGPKMIRLLWERLKIRSVADLERAAGEGKIRALPRFGMKSEQKILKGIAFLKEAGGRRLLGLILPEIRALGHKIQVFPEVEKVVIAGSVRRMKETIGDIDILAVSKKPDAVMERFVTLPEVMHIYARGKTKTLVRLKNGLDADLRVVKKRSWGAALNYFTGSKAHNVALREIALKMGMKLNEYGLFRANRFVAGRTEEELYKALKLEYIAPELREDQGEIDAARHHILPHLIGYKDLQGDLQVQTDWTDGTASIEEMARGAKKKGLNYIAITDHTRSLAMTKGADEEKLRRQMVAIDKLNRELFPEADFTILKSAEVNIQKDGRLDIADTTLAKLDLVGAAVHSHFGLARLEQTARVIRAMENPHVDIIFHLTGRLIHKRAPIDLDIDAVITAAKRTGTVLEINAYPERLDLKDVFVRKCVDAGVLMSIDSDAHAISHFDYLPLGIAQARRGWATRDHIVNAWPLKKMQGFLKREQRRGKI